MMASGGSFASAESVRFTVHAIRDRQTTTRGESK